MQPGLDWTAGRCWRVKTPTSSTLNPAAHLQDNVLGQEVGRHLPVQVEPHAGRHLQSEAQEGLWVRIVDRPYTADKLQRSLPVPSAQGRAGMQCKRPTMEVTQDTSQQVDK